MSRKSTFIWLVIAGTVIALVIMAHIFSYSIGNSDIQSIIRHIHGS